jgi:hypothetical protein
VALRTLEIADNYGTYSFRIPVAACITWQASASRKSAHYNVFFLQKQEMASPEICEQLAVEEMNGPPRPRKA